MTKGVVAEPETDDAIKTSAQLFRYSTWLHVGAGAEDCADVDEDAGEVSCANPLHFHAWCRLANQFQHREIREKAMAARARRVRQMRDPNSDSYAILADDLDTLLRQPGAHDALVDELVSRDWWKDYIEAVRELNDVVDDHDEHPWAGIDHDRERYAELQALDPDARPAEEFAELEAHITRYTAAVNEAHEAIAKPKRDALTARDINDLADLVREQRINIEAHEEFMHIYSMWQWFAGTRRTPHGEQRFTAIEVMQAAAPEVIAALATTFDDLEQTFEDGPTKNS